MSKDFDGVWLSYVNPVNFFQKEYSKRKSKLTLLQMKNMLRRTLKMFEWKGLPETIPQRILELNLQTRGHIGVFMNGDKLHASWGTLGGTPNYNYMPSWYIVSNPYLDNVMGTTFHIYGENKDIVVIPNDSLYEGLIETLSYHSEILTEIQLTKRCIIIRKRNPEALTAMDNNAKVAIEAWYDKLMEGDLTFIQDKNLLRPISTVGGEKSDGHNILTQVLEMEQYQKASLYNELGLQMNYNMKRETITSSEAQLGESALLPLPDDMYEMRKIACDEINALFGTKWSVDFASAWKDLRKSIAVGMSVEESKIIPSVEGVENGVQSTVREEKDESEERVSTDNNRSNESNEQSNNEGDIIQEELETIVEAVETISEVSNYEKETP